MSAIRFQPSQTIAFDGDSLTCLRNSPALDQWPWLRISNSHRSWADVFSELLFAWRPDLRLNFRTVAVGGSTCRELAARFDATIAVIRPDWVFMTVGGNDATRQIPLDEFESSLRRYAGRVGEWGGKVVFVCGFLPCPGAAEVATERLARRRPYYEIEMRLAAEIDNVHALDIGQAVLQKANELHAWHPLHTLYSDGTHFSHLGAMVVAGEVLKACAVL